MRGAWERIIKDPFVVFLFILALFLRLWHLGRQSLWIHEAFSLWVSSHSFSQIIGILETDAHPPLFYFLLHLWMKSGLREATLRFPFALLGAVNAILVYKLGERLVDRRIGTAAGTLWAISFAALNAETQLRMYSLAICFSLCGTLCFFDALHSPSIKRWVLYFIFSLLSVFTYYYCGFIILTQLLLLLYMQRRREAVWISVLLLAAFAPWIPHFLSQFLIRLSPRPVPGGPEIFALSGLLGAYDFLQSSRANALASFVGAAGMVWGMVHVWKRGNIEGIFLFAVIVVGGIFPYAVSLLSPLQIFLFRYAVIIAPYFFILFLTGVSKMPRVLSISCCIALILVNLGLWGVFLTNRNFQRQNWGDASQVLQSRLGSGDVVIVEHFMSLFPLWYYIPGAFEIRYRPGEYLFDIVPLKKGGPFWIPVNGKIPPQILEKFCHTSQRQWLVLCQDRTEDPNGKVLSWFFRHQSQRFYAQFPSLQEDLKIRLFLFERGSSEE